MNYLWFVIFATMGGAGLLYKFGALTSNCSQFNNVEVVSACTSANDDVWLGVVLLVIVSILVFVLMKLTEKKKTQTTKSEIGTL